MYNSVKDEVNISEEKGLKNKYMDLRAGTPVNSAPKADMTFAGQPSRYRLRHRRKQTTLNGSVAGSRFDLVQHYNLFKPDVIEGKINNEEVNLTLDKESRFEGTIGSTPVNIILTAKGATAILAGVFEGATIDVKVKRGLLSTSIKGRNINLKLNSGTFSLSESKNYKGTYAHNPDLIPFIISIVESIVFEENLFYLAA
ncbi:MAG: hypothetical protein LBK53_07810 [Heliobacteriaceae bacterium]|jgi:hypothetical protein|nr:hypothetical protein [Heliobacteriaceae bacterium]